MIGVASALISFLAITAYASPAPNYGRPRKSPRGLQDILLPTSSLPATGGNKELRFVTLGLGTQNYTCADSKPETKPVLLGALADLIDVSAELDDNPDRMMSLPGKALEKGRAPCRRCRKIGDHYFTGPSPVFAFNQARPRAQIMVKKISEAPAPADAHPGLTKEGAVAWLFLVDNEAGQTFGGIDTVYRVVTAGGKPPASCANADPKKLITVKYATLYFTYGPKTERRRRGGRP